MSYNGTGTHNKIHDWTTDLQGAIPVTASRMDEQHDDFSSSLTNCVCKDGQTTTTARIPFASGLSAAGGSTASVAYSQTNDNNTGLYFPASDQFGLVAGGTEVLTGTSSGITISGTLTPSGQIVAAAGTVGAPGYAFASDLDCGMYRIGANNIGLAVNGAKVVDIGTAGAAITGTLSATGATTSGGALTVSAGGAAITGNSTVTGTLTVSSTLTASNGFTVSAGTVTLPTGSIETADLADGAVTNAKTATTLVGSWTHSGDVTVVDFTGLAAYDKLTVVFIDVTLASSTSPILRTSTDNGSSFATTNYDSRASDDATATASTAGIVLSDGNTSGLDYGSVDVYAFNNASFKSAFRGVVNAAANAMVTGLRDTAEANNALRFTTTGGVNITAGTILVYGSK